jgi:hypothetical protein
MMPCRIYLALVLLVAPRACAADSSREVSPPPASVLVPAGTDIRLALKQELVSGASKVGDPVLCEVAADVRLFSTGTVAIPAGTVVTGHLSRSTRAGGFGKSGRLEFTCEAMRFADGRTIPLTLPTPRQAAAREGSAGGAGALAGTGAALATRAATQFPTGGRNGGVSAAAGVGVGLLTSLGVRGRNLTLKPGSEVILRLDHDLLLSGPPPATHPSSSQGIDK